MPRVGNDLGARLLEFPDWDSTPAARQEGEHGSSLSTLRRSGCAQGDCGRLHAAHGGRTVKREVRTFDTITTGLLALADWLASEGCTDVVMEATGVYWKPVWHILSDGDFDVGAGECEACQERAGPQDRRQRRHLVGRSSCPWSDPALRAGCRDPGFAQPVAHAKQLVRERSSHVQRLQKTLEDANIKLDSVVTDIIGMTGRAMLQALIAGETDPGKLAALAHPRIKAPPARLREALRGRVMKHHRFLLRLHLQQIDAIDTAVAEIDREVDDASSPFASPSNC